VVTGDLISLLSFFESRKNIFGKVKFIIPVVCSFCLLPDDSAGRIARELWWMNQEFSSVDIIPPWFSMLTYHLRDNQYACWWLPFRETVSPHHHQSIYLYLKFTA
jgi:hypothetical protein